MTGGIGGWRPGAGSVRGALLQEARRARLRVETRFLTSQAELTAQGVDTACPAHLGNTGFMVKPWSLVPGSARRFLGRLPLSESAVRLARKLSADRLRILAFHGVPDLAQFELVIDEALEHYTPVSEDDVVRAIVGDVGLPPHPVWFTFDDGLPSTLAAGARLAERNIRATAFVCPSVLDTTDRLWFQTWDEASELGLLATMNPQKEYTLSHLKNAPDAERRTSTGLLESRLSTAGAAVFHQATQEMLEDWVSAGHYIGNHTWDHPLLDRCSPADQRLQVSKAHEELVGRGFTPRFLAYPNGNTAPAAMEAARDLGYVGSLLFDHRLTRLRQDPHRLSRLRIDSDVPRKRAASILSGAHSAMLHLAT